MQPVQASTQTATPYFSPSTSSPSLGKIFKVVILGFLATLGGASAQQTFQIGNHTTGLRRASCIEMDNGDLNCAWMKDGDLYREVVSPIFEDVIPQVITETVGNHGPPNLYKKSTGGYNNLWTSGSPKGFKIQKYTETHGDDGTEIDIPPQTIEVEKVAATFLPDGDFVVGAVERDTNNKFTDQVYFDGNTQRNIPDLEVIYNDEIDIYPTLFSEAPEAWGWSQLYVRDSDFHRIRYTDQRTEWEDIIISSSSGTSVFRQQKGKLLGNGHTLVVWAKISDTNQIEGYYYKRFDRDSNFFDVTDEVLMEGNLGAWDGRNDILSVASGENNSTWCSFVANGDVHTQEFSMAGIKVGGPQSMGTSGASEVSSFKITDGPGITWRNASGLFGRIWNRVFPTPTPTTAPSPSSSTSEIPTSAAFTTTPDSTLSESVSSSQGQSADSTAASTSSAGGNSTSSTTEELPSSILAPTAPRTMSPSSLLGSSEPTFAETLSTRGSSSSVSGNNPPVIDVEIIPLTVDPFVSSWEVIDGTLHVTFAETVDIEDGSEVTLFTFATGEGNWETLTLEADAGSCLAVSSRIEDNRDGTSSYIGLFESYGCGGNAGNQVRPSWVSVFFGIFSGIFGRVKNWV